MVGRIALDRWSYRSGSSGDYGEYGPLFSGVNNSKAAELLGLSYSTYDRAHTVYACVDRITSRARRCPWMVQQQGPDDRLEILPPADPLATVLRTPNTYQGSGELREVVIRSLLLTGEAFVLADLRRDARGFAPRDPVVGHHHPAHPAVSV